MGLAVIFTDLSWVMALLFILGIILIVIEMIMPGFGVAGTLGVISLLLGVVAASRIVTPVQLSMIIALVLIVIVSMLSWIYRSATKGGRISKLLLLNSKLGKEEGYNSGASLDDIIGKEGVAVTILRPSGIGEFDGLKYDVIADGEYIQKESKIRIVRVEGFRILVIKI